MKSIYTAVSIFLLGLMVAGCTGTTALQSSESDDLYYSSTDRTTIQQAGSGSYTGAVSNSGTGYSNSSTSSGEVVNPDYSGTNLSSGSGQTAVTNNYNYYDDGYSYSRPSRSYRTYNSYGYAPYYSPFGYSAAYCYGIYDPFWYPGYYPYSGVSISIGFGYPAYGYGYPGYGCNYGYSSFGYGYAPYYSPYGYYGGGYGGYYQGFYDGYYAGNSYGTGFHRNVNYAPRRDRASSPVNVPGGNINGGRPPMPGRVGDPYQPGNAGAPGGRPRRVVETQPGNSTPNTAPNPNRIDQPGTNTPGYGGRPQREMQQVRPENYQFQQTPVQQNQAPQPGLGNRPTRGRDSQMPVYQNNVPAQESAPMQMQQPVRQESRPNFQGRPAEQQSMPVQPQPSQQNYSRPQRGNFQMRGNDGGGFQQPSFQNHAPMGGGMHQGGGFGRPGR